MTNDAQTLQCRSDLVFRGEPGGLGVYGYHALEALEGLRGLQPLVVDLPGFRIGAAEGGPQDWPVQFFYADSKRRLWGCVRSGDSGFGYALDRFQRQVDRQAPLCGFVGGPRGDLAFLGRPLDGAARLVADSRSPRVAMRFELPQVIAPGQRFESMWKLMLPADRIRKLETLQGALQSLKGPPIDLGAGGGSFTIGDGLVSHRIFALSPSGNPAGDDGWCYLIDGGGQLGIVGAGADAWRWPWMLRIRALGFDPRRVRRILLTHTGLHHVNGARALARRTGAEICLHEIAREAVSVAGPEHDQRTGARWLSDAGPFEPFEIDLGLGADETFPLGDLQVRFLHTPGPSGENGIYLLTAGGITTAFVGDLAGAQPPPGDRASRDTDAHSHGNLSDWLDSLLRLRSLHVDVLAPSHAPPVQGMREIDRLLDRPIAACKAIFGIPKVDYLLPRPFVVRLAPDAPPPRGDELWAAKELPRPAFWHEQSLEIADGLWQIGGGFLAEAEDANVYLVDGGDEMALIGAGSGLHTARILRRLLALRKNPRDIDYILLPSSHWHEARGANLLRAATGARVCAHRHEAASLWAGDGVATGLTIGRFRFGAFPPCRVDRMLKWGETLRVGRREILVLDAPGFHRGSTAFLMTIDKRRCLATGEAAWGDLETPDGGIVRGATGWLDPHWGGCLVAWTETIERFLAIRPDVLLPGQGRVEKDEIDRQLEECLDRLGRLDAIDGARALLPLCLFESEPVPRRPDISRLEEKR
jgi:glyoxylase-like metal-dependent hydrolase (beta-lactamase superfamily II)